MRDAFNSIVALAAIFISVMALIVTIYYNHKSIAINVAKDKPLIRTNIIKYTVVSWTVLFVKNVGVGMAYNVVLVISGKKCPSFDLMVNESKSIPVNVTDGLIINSLTYTDIYENEYTKSDITPETIVAESGFL